MNASRILFSTLLFLTAQALAWAGFGGVASVGELAQRADLVVVATIQKVTDQQFSDGTSRETIELHVIRTLKGQLISPSLLATVVPGSRSAIGILARSLVGATGVWFLRDNPSVHEVLPLVREMFAGRDTFVPVQLIDESTAPSGTLGHQVLTYQLRWYESLPYPTPSEDDLVFESLVHNQGEDAGDAIATLRHSKTLNQHVVGIAAAIRLGSSDALLQVACELETLRSRINFNLVLSTISRYMGHQSAATVEALEKLAALHSDVPGLDDALSSALACGIGEGFIATAAPPSIRTALPAMRLLLDSKDPTAQLRAARFFAYFAQFADASGSIPGTGVTGPFASADARRFNPTEGVSMSAARYAQFWKDWYAQNNTKLGF